MRRSSWGIMPLLTAGLLLAACAENPGDEELPEPAVTASGDGEPGVPGPPGAEPSAPTTWPEAIIREVLAMEQADERVRAMIASLLESAPQDTAQLRRAAVEQDRVDETNAARLQAIIRAHGWPSRGEVGAEAATAAYLIVQHADHDVPFQKEYLAFLEQEHARGQAPGEAVAQLADLIRLAEGRPQLYGTQVEIVNGQLVVAPLEAGGNVDSRRATLGLGSLAEYLARVKQVYGIPE